MKEPLFAGSALAVGRSRLAPFFCLLLCFAACPAQAPRAESAPLRVGGVSVAFGLEPAETAMLAPAAAAEPYVQAVLGKGLRFSQCFFVVDAAFKRRLISGPPTTEEENRRGLHAMIVVTEQPCDAAFLKAARDAALASTKDKRALTEHYKEVQAKATQDAASGITPLKVSPEEAVRQIGQAGLIGESDRHITVGIGSDEGIVITTYVSAESRLVVFAQWTDQRNFAHCIERAKAFSDFLIGQTK